MVNDTCSLVMSKPLVPAGLNGGTWVQGCSSGDCLLAEMLKQGGLPFYHCALGKASLKADLARGHQTCCVLVTAMVATSIRSRIQASYRGPSITPRHLEGKVVAVLISKGSNGLIPGLGGECRTCNMLMAHTSNLSPWEPGGMRSCG